MKKITIILFLILCTLNSYSQNLEYRSVYYYFDIVGKLELEELKKEGIINDSLKRFSFEYLFLSIFSFQYSNFVFDKYEILSALV